MHATAVEAILAISALAAPRATAFQSLERREETSEDLENDDVKFRVPPTASKQTRRLARYLQKDLHFPDLFLMLLFQASPLPKAPLECVQQL